MTHSAHPSSGRHPQDPWQEQAACRGMDISLFYAADGERAPAARRRNAKAKAVCAQCTVIDPCRRWALATRERWGVWGGLTPDERLAVVDHRSA